MGKILRYTWAKERAVILFFQFQTGRDFKKRVIVFAYIYSTQQRHLLYSSKTSAFYQLGLAMRITAEVTGIKSIAF
jgi:hypothetical protein